MKVTKALIIILVQKKSSSSETGLLRDRRSLWMNVIKKSLRSAMSKFELEYRNASHRIYAHRVRKYVDEMGTTSEREKELKEFSYQKFLDGRQMKLHKHNNDLRR